jgi:hypothetical protein
MLLFAAALNSRGSEKKIESALPAAKGELTG